MIQLIGVLINQRELAFGTRPLFLRRFTHKGIDTVFICSDRPTVIHSTNHKLAYSNVNLKLVTHMCPLNSSYYTNCLVLSDSKTLIIGIKYTNLIFLPRIKSENDLKFVNKLLLLRNNR